jgi:hypothetical protein
MLLEDRRHFRGDQPSLTHAAKLFISHPESPVLVSVPTVGRELGPHTRKRTGIDDCH